jgi:hypothetical protein
MLKNPFTKLRQKLSRNKTYFNPKVSGMLNVKVTTKPSVTIRIEIEQIEGEIDTFEVDTNSLKSNLFYSKWELPAYYVHTKKQTKPS